MATVFQDKRMRNAAGNPAWCLNYRGLDARQRRERTEATTKDEAESLLRRKMSDLSKSRANGLQCLDALQITFREFVERYYRPTAKRAKTEQGFARDEQALKRLLPQFGTLPLRLIRKGMIEDYRRKRLEGKIGRPIAESTANRELAILSAILQEAFRHEFIDANAVRRVKKLREKSHIIRFLTDKEEMILLDLAPSYLRPMITLAIHTGLRKGELLSLTWPDVDLERAEIRVQATKTGKTRFVPLNDVALEILKALPRHIKSPFVFVNTDTGERWYDLKPVWYRQIVPGLKRRGVPPVRFHDLRHTFASRLVQRGVPLDRVRDLLGHGSLTMTLRYAHLRPDDLRRAVDVLVAPTVSERKAKGGGRNRGAM